MGRRRDGAAADRPRGRPTAARARRHADGRRSSSCWPSWGSAPGSGCARSRPRRRWRPWPTASCRSATGSRPGDTGDLAGPAGAGAARRRPGRRRDRRPGVAARRGAARRRGRRRRRPDASPTPLDGIATDALPPLVEVADAVDPAALRPVDGRIDLAPLVAAAPGLSTAAEATARARDAVVGLDPDALHGPLPDAVAELQAQVADAADTLGAARAGHRGPAVDARRRRTAHLPGPVPQLRRAADVRWHPGGDRGDHRDTTGRSAWARRSRRPTSTGWRSRRCR